MYSWVQYLSFCFHWITCHFKFSAFSSYEKANWDKKFSKIGHMKVIGNQPEFLLRQIFCWFTTQVVIRWRLLHMKHVSEWDRSLFPLRIEKVHWCEYSPWNTQGMWAGGWWKGEPKEWSIPKTVLAGTDSLLIQKDTWERMTVIMQGV